MADETDDFEACAIPGPEDCVRRRVVAGTPVPMGDGRTWILADYVPRFAPCFDRAYDGNVLRASYQLEDIQLAASHLLLENYDLPPEAAAVLIGSADDAALVRAVEEALFGPVASHVTWSDWALGSLFANGIDPATVPPDRLRAVLEILVETGRAIPPGKCISATVAGSRIAALRSRIKPREATQTAPQENEANDAPE